MDTHIIQLLLSDDPPEVQIIAGQEIDQEPEVQSSEVENNRPTSTSSLPEKTETPGLIPD